MPYQFYNQFMKIRLIDNHISLWKYQKLRGTINKQGYLQCLTLEWQI
jgi:hypothetical protein